MKLRPSSSPIHVRAPESTAFRVHIQNPKLLPSIVELSRVHKRKCSTDSVKTSRSVKEITIDYAKPCTSGRGQICKWELSGHPANKQFEDEPSTSNGSSEQREAETQEFNRTTDKIRTFQERFDQSQKELELRGLEKEDLTEVNVLLTAFKEVETTSISATEQVTTLKNSVAELIQANQLSASELDRFAGEKDLLLEKLQKFELANKGLQYLLKESRNPGSCMDCSSRHLKVLTQKLARSETENIHLKRKLLDIETNAKEFSEQYQTEKDNSCFVKQLAKSVEATQARLQGQLRDKEAKGSRMSVQILKHERTVMDQKLQIVHVRSQLSALREKGEEDKEVLKKAMRAQERRAERFEVALEKLNSQTKDTDRKLLETCMTINNWKKQHELAVEEKAQLETEMISLSERLASLEEQLQSCTEKGRITHHELLNKLHNSDLENSNLRLENAHLKVSLSDLEEKASMTTTEFEQLKVQAKQQEKVVLQYETQAGDRSFQLKSSLEKVESLNEEKQNLQVALEALSRKLKEVGLQNQELTETIAKQEEGLLQSRCQLEQRTRESAALSQQLQAALHDVSEKVNEVKGQERAQECELRSNVHNLESELNQKKKELKQLQWNVNSAEMSHKTQLQELKLHLEQSENENQSIQNYVEFLKMSYAIMFGDSSLTEYHSEPSLR